MIKTVRNKKTTIRDVAAKAGVSYQTVSRVLNNSAQVSQGTREQVLKVIEELEYSPDPVATSLATNRSYTLGMITATFTGNSMVRVLEGADTYALQHGYQIVISGEEHHSRSEPLSLPFVKRQRVDGMLIIYHGSKNDHHQILRDIPESIPIVSTGYAFNQKNIVVVRVNTRKGAKEAMDHLIGLGHRSIAMITGASGAYETVERNFGYRQALKKAGISHKPSLTVEGDWFVESGYNAGRALLATGRCFSAVFAHSDRMAMGCISALVEQGIRVPEDVAVIGFNDIEEARYFSPSLTTVYYPAYQHGRICAKLLIALTMGDKSTEKKLNDEDFKSLGTHLIVRRSCGAYLKERGE